MVAPQFPAGIFNWGTDRIDELDIDFAIDVNGPAAEVMSIESTLGVMPQVEKHPINGGSPITYATVDARISAMQQGILPYISLTFDEAFVPNNCGAGTYYGQWNTYDVAVDPFGMYNGNDVTVPVTGWYITTINQDWDYWTTGYHRCSFWCSRPGFGDEEPFGLFPNIGYNFFCDHIWHWDFAQNFPGGWWWPDYHVQPVARSGHNNVTWQGVLTAGSRMSVLSENGTPHTPHRVSNGSFKAVCTQRLPDTTPFG